MTTSPIIFDTSDGQSLRINMIGSWLKRQFGRKIIKLSVDGGFTCPNRDGTKGTGGCLFCSGAGSGDMASAIPSVTDDAKGCRSPESFDASGIRSALDEQVELLRHKWPQAGYMAYFQNYTNTYGPAEKLTSLFTAALKQPDIMGLAIATRPDCIREEALELLDALNRRTFLWVELGLQTMHDATAAAMNLCHTRADYEDAVARLHARGIRTVTHLILGLPGESQQQMLDSVRYVSSDPLFGVKLHMLNVVRSSALPLRYPGYVPFQSIQEYTDLIVEALELIPPQITVHRISGDAPRRDLIAPDWSWRKRTILNEIHRSMREKNTWQGRRCKK